MIFYAKKNPIIILTVLTVILASTIFLQISSSENSRENNPAKPLSKAKVNLLRNYPNLGISQVSRESFIEIFVNDASTSLPINAALVSVYDETSGANIGSATTNEEGFTNISDLYVGFFKIVISKASASPYRTEELFLNIDVLGEFKRFNIYLIEQRAINGTIETIVLDYTGNPIPKAKVDIQDEGSGILTSEITNESGVATTTDPLHAGTYYVNASAPGYYSKNATITLSWYGDKQEVTIVLFPKSTVSARIEICSRDAITEENLSYVHMEIFDMKGISIWTGMTDENGLVVVYKLDMGNFSITANHDTYNGDKKNIYLHYPNDYKKVSFSLYPTSSNLGYIEIFAVNQQTSPISSAKIVLYNEKGQLVTSGSTNEAGFYNITGLSQGTYKLRVLDDLYYSYEQEIVIRWNTDKKTVEVIVASLDEVGSINIEFLNISGDPISGVLVNLYNNNDELVSSHWTEKTILEIKDLELGTYQLTAFKKGLQSFESEIDLHEKNHITIAENLFPNTGAGSFDVQTPLNSYIIVKNTDGNMVFSGTCESGEQTVSGIPLGDYGVSIFTSEGEQSFTESINWIGDTKGISWQKMVDITDNSSCMEFTIYDFELGLLENCRVDVITQNGYSFSGNTDSNGFVNITGLFLGQYEVVCSKWGYRDTVVPKSIDFIGQKRISVLYIYQAKGDVHVHVSEVFSGDPYPAYVRYKRDYGEWTFLVHTDWNGYKAFYDLQMGYYNFCVMVGGYETQYQAVYIDYDGDVENIHFMLTVPGGDGQIDHYALIIAGGDEQRFTHDAYLLYNTLFVNYGYYSTNMFLLTPHAVDSVSGDTVPRNMQTSATAVEWAVNQIGMLADADDQVVIMWTGHGNFLINTVTDTIIEGQFQTHDDNIGSIDFDSWLDGIQCNDMYIYLGPCHSGYWIDELNDEPNRAIYTSCRWDENGWATNTHSYWPWGINRALNPNLSAQNADDDSNGKVSLWELFEWTDHYVRVSKDCNQNPQRYVGSGINYGNDYYRYIGDGTYNSPFLGTGAMYQMINQNVDSPPSYQRKSHIVDSDSGVAIVPNVGMEDNINLNPILSFELYNASLLPTYNPVPNVQILIRDLFGTIIASGFSNMEGCMTFHDITDGRYVWEVILDGDVIGSGPIQVQRTQFVCYAYSDNYDYQGDVVDIKIQVMDQLKGINIPNVIVTLYHADGEKFGIQTTDFNGAVIFNDVGDGYYGYEASIGGVLLDDGTISVRGSDFTLETDTVSPIVNIISPTTEEMYEIPNNLPTLVYTVDEANNYTITVYLNGNLLESIQNNSILTEIISPSSYNLKVEATDVSENIGHATVEFQVIEYTSSTSKYTSSTSQIPGFSLINIMIILAVISLSVRKKRINGPIT